MPREVETVCALVSGGVDSAVLVGSLLEQRASVQPLYVRAGMVWEGVEEHWLQKYLAAVGSPHLHPLHAVAVPLGDVYGPHWSLDGRGVPGYEAADETVYLPGRNLVLVSQAAIYCSLRRIDRIALGLLGGNPFPDATEPFFHALSHALNLGLGRSLQIERPFASMSKAEVIRLGRALPLELTFSCLRPVGQMHCGECNKCAERRRGFRDAGVPDPTAYARSRETA